MLRDHEFLYKTVKKCWACWRTTFSTIWTVNLLTQGFDTVLTLRRRKIVKIFKTVLLLFWRHRNITAISFWRRAACKTFGLPCFKKLNKLNYVVCCIFRASSYIIYVLYTFIFFLLCYFPNPKKQSFFPDWLLPLLVECFSWCCFTVSL